MLLVLKLWKYIITFYEIDYVDTGSSLLVIAVKIKKDDVRYPREDNIQKYVVSGNGVLLIV